MKSIDTTSHLYAPAEADRIAKEMNASDDWDYVVTHCPNGTGYSFISIYDEDGEFVAKM